MERTDSGCVRSIPREQPAAGVVRCRLPSRGDQPLEAPTVEYRVARVTNTESGRSEDTPENTEAPRPAVVAKEVPLRDETEIVEAVLAELADPVHLGRL